MADELARERNIWRQVMPAVVVGLIVCAVFLFGRTQEEALTELTDETVVATLGSAATPYPAELRLAAARVRETPQDREAALDAARRYMEYGRAIGDARFAGAALGVLTPWVERAPDPAILNLAASARQYMHDFDGAISLLDQATALSPYDAQAMLSRANIYVVKGQFGQASQDCIALSRARRPDLAVLCDTTVRALTDDAPAAYERLEALLASRAMDPALDGYANSLLAEIARFQLWPDKARARFEAALQESPDDLRTLMTFADFELAAGRAQAALDLLDEAPEADSIMVRQAIAYKALNRSRDLRRVSDILRARIQASAAAGETAHAREAARFWIEVQPDASNALAAAQTNWETQRELEDALLFLAAANLANQPEAAQPVRAWATEQGVEAPMYRQSIVADRFAR